MRQAGDGAHGACMRALIVLLWRAGAARHRGAHRHRARPRAPRRIGARPPRQGRPPPRGRHGPLRLGPPPALARAPRDAAGRPAAVRDRRPHPRRALGQRLSCGASPRRPECGGGSPHQLRHVHAVELAHASVPLIPTSASPPSICKASTTPRSSPPSTAARRDDPRQHPTPHLTGPARQSHRNCSRR
jgi:hypothetical protein